MIHRLKLSNNTSEILKELQSSTQLTPNILARLAVGASLTNNSIPEIPNYRSNNGLEINRQTFTGEYDQIYKTLISQHAGKLLTDEEYFPTLFNAHLERGITIIQNEYKYAGNADKFYENMLKFNAE
ncbi:DNA sulfur modification protein DndE [Gottfriedia luciferensis]|uniref:DNA sulfur modification protein DndE n=1 Tax=Gottfriedia luciferensis TaxID=178774 RepID=A0ABX2ZP41_9BACI|nr:DNA sulfur modification protein DndE [Gottfriedia luciferensis]ODG91506.1 DNA sulfur modification protein DndE [Gottfriedia luciferensis]